MKIKQVKKNSNDTKQKSCSNCKLRISCKLLKEQLEQNNITNEYAESLVSMSFICDNYKQMFIEYPILVQKITTDYNFDKHNEQLNVGKYCITTIFEDGYENIPYLGLYLGEQPLSILSAYESESATIRNKFITNPAIYIFSFKKIFFGVNTKWKFIENIEDLKLVEDEKLSCGFFENVKKTL